MAERIRADYDLLVEIARTIERQSNELGLQADRMRRQVEVLEGGDWIGAGARAFYREMGSEVLPAMQRLVKGLQSAARTTQQASRTMRRAEDESAALFRSALAGAGSGWMEWLHGGLDVVGFVPAVGEVADAINALIFLAEGRHLEAGISAAAMIPVLGDAGKIGKWTVKAGKELTEAASERGAREFAESMADAYKRGASAGDVVPSSRLTRGLLGEKLATEALAADGHKVISWKPDLSGTNRPGFDIITVRDDYLYAIDNKALTRAGNVSEVSSLTRNFDNNLASARQEIQAALDGATLPEQRQVLTEAIQALDAGRVRRVVTNANWTPDDKILTGVTEGLEREGIEFIDVFK
jgi:WXG100 family type VII secretion target